MILEGFEIENWSCIKRVVVESLPSTGVIVLHGPNGTGKSSIVAALRACLLDYAATTSAKDLKRFFPKNSTDKPRVSVTFRVQGTTWRITKQFGGKESTLHCRTAAGTWRLEQSTAADSHEHARRLQGGKNSDQGLQQLLWLTQGEFRMPDAKEFDGDVQSQLRAVLGVMQTPLDDRVLARIKETRSQWFGARARAGEKPKLKNDCPLDKAIKDLKKQEAELEVIEADFQKFERMMQRSSDLEMLARDLRRKIDESSRICAELQAEYERSLTRIDAHRVAGERVEQAKKQLTAARGLQRKRADVDHRFGQATRDAARLADAVDERTRELRLAETKLRDARLQLQERRDRSRELRGRSEEVQNQLERLVLKEKTRAARQRLNDVEQAIRELDELKSQARDCPAPDAGMLRKLEDNRRRATQLHADMQAAAMSLTLSPEPGAAGAELTIDGAQAEAAASNHAVRRRVEIVIPGWGRVEFTRGAADTPGLEQIESEAARLDRDFGEAVAAFGIPAADPAALDRARTLAAEQKAREPELRRRRQEIDRLCPEGIDSLRQQAAELDRICRITGDDSATSAAELETQADRLKVELQQVDSEVSVLEHQANQCEHDLDGEPGRAGLRGNLSLVDGKQREFKATADVLREELGRMPTAEQLERDLHAADEALSTAQRDLESATLSDSEQTVRDRLNAAEEALGVLQRQLAETEREFHRIEGEMRHTEGLHQRRAAAAVRVEDLKQRVERERLESDAHDRLFTLFEECREKQFDAVLAPIHDRVLRWMKLLRIGGYQAMRFNPQFLPERLVGRDGATELAFEEESTGTIEQMALMVRLALGSALSSFDEPAVAIFDDPLTHSDTVRLQQMRAVLRGAAAGDASCTPPAGPLQILVFTCHPEWFTADGATIIDLGRPDVLQRGTSG